MGLPIRSEGQSAQPGGALGRGGQEQAVEVDAVSDGFLQRSGCGALARSGSLGSAGAAVDVSEQGAGSVASRDSVEAHLAHGAHRQQAADLTP